MPASDADPQDTVEEIIPVTRLPQVTLINMIAALQQAGLVVGTNIWRHPRYAHPQTWLEERSGPCGYPAFLCFTFDFAAVFFAAR